MQGRIDTSFQTLQRDLFASGLAAQIGMNAFGVWLAIKSHADFNTGQAWPGMRRLGELTGLSLGAVSNSVKALVDAKLLRIDRVAKGKSRKGNTYTARERLDVRVGDRVLCTIVLDYVPATMRQRLGDIDRALSTGKGGAEIFAQCEIIPGKGFTYDSSTGSFVGLLPSSDIPAPDASEQRLKAPIVERLLEMQNRSRRTRR